MQLPQAANAIPSTLQHPAARFWLALIGTGVVAGLGAAGLTRLLETVQRFIWGGTGRDLLAAAGQATLANHVLALLKAGASHRGRPDCPTTTVPAETESILQLRSGFSTLWPSAFIAHFRQCNSLGGYRRNGRIAWTRRCPEAGWGGFLPTSLQTERSCRMSSAAYWLRAARERECPAAYGVPLEGPSSLWK